MRSEYLRQYARLWRQLKLHGQDMNRCAVNGILDAIRAREADLRREGVPMRGSGPAAG